MASDARRFIPVLIAVALTSLPGSGSAGEKDAARAEAFIKEMGAKAAAAGKAGRSAVRGKDGWLFFRGELRSIGAGRFWGDEAAKVSRASRKKYADPLPAIVEFKKQLDSVGVELLLVPVPPKAFVYPDKLSEKVGAGADDKPPRLDVHHQEFYKVLKSEGVEVLDLWPELAARRFEKAGAAYCRQDTHWSSKACQLAARLIAGRYRAKAWFRGLAKLKFERKTKPLTITGDLWKFLKDKGLAREKLPMVFAGRREAAGGALLPPPADRKSPVVLIGDSHTLVFSAGGDMHTRGAGLADHLAAEFGARIDLVGVRGSGVSVPRIDLARRKDNLKGKKLVVWCFSARQFTESANGWMTRIPLIRKKK